ncbi:MAG TPA: TonB-dependent receptor [Rhodanobacter sp.]
MKPVSATLGCLLLASAISTGLHAQQEPPVDTTADAAAEKRTAKAQDAVELGAITVTTGTRIATAIDKIPGAITVVSKAEVERTLLLTEDATAVLTRSVPGYAESSQAMSNSGETLRGRIALRLFDGVPQGTPLREGTRNGTFTDMGVIGRIEVINGPSAAEGIGAAGGIINYISKVPTTKGHETTLTTRYSTQFGTDSGQYKVGVNHAYKGDAGDGLLSVSYIDRGISYDGDGRRIGMNTSGSTSDSVAKNLFLKGGYNFGADEAQRIQASYSKFKVAGKANYIQVEGCRFDPVSCPVPTTNTSERGSIFGSKAEFNDFDQMTVNYSHRNVFGGIFTADAYWSDQAMRYLPENGSDRQLVKPAPPENERIFDQSEITSKKKGFRTSWTRGDLFDVEGLQSRIGLDLVEDVAAQRLALTNRVWVPPMEYTSKAPYVQLTWDVGPLTVSGGVRREDGKLHVDSYTTTAFRNSVQVQGGGLKYVENMKNLGAIWRLNDDWSVFASYGEGFGLPNIGIPLRNISVPGQSVDRIKDLQAIIVENREVGFNWRGEQGSLGMSYYDSKSPFGASLSVDPVSNDFVLTRAPTRIKGVEFNSGWTFNDDWKASLLYSRIRGKTQYYDGSGLVKDMGVLDISPDKIVASVTWNFMPDANMTLGATKLLSRDLRSTYQGGNGRTYVNEENTTGYTLVDLGVNYQTASIGKFSLGVENLFNKQYVLSWSQLPGWQNFWAGRGRVVSLSHSITF